MVRKGIWPAYVAFCLQDIFFVNFFCPKLEYTFHFIPYQLTLTSILDTTAWNFLIVFPMQEWKYSIESNGSTEENEVWGEGRDSRCTENCLDTDTKSILEKNSQSQLMIWKSSASAKIQGDRNAGIYIHTTLPTHCSGEKTSS